jgi:chromosome segregation ATPase
MRAADCNYMAVPYTLVEEALREYGKALVAHAPRGKSTAALEKQIEELQANADHLEGLTFQLAEALAREKSAAARQRLRDAEAQLKVLQKALRDLRAQRDTLTTASVRDRLKAVQEALREANSRSMRGATDPCGARSLSRGERHSRPRVTR